MNNLIARSIIHMRAASLLAGASIIAAAGGIAISLAAPAGQYQFGAYDPEGTYSNDGGVDIEHLFMPWEDVELETLHLADAYAMERGRTLLVTIEPWTWTRDARNTPEALRTGIFNGTYDKNMAAICTVLSQLKSEVTVRFAHEMDDLSGQFIWAGWAADTYIRAYRRMIDVCRAQASGLTYMWSPLGEETLKDYYPGDDYVDVVGLSVFGLQEYDNDKFGHNRTFAEILKPRYERAEVFGKPVVVAELGYVGDADYVTQWESTVRVVDASFPALTSVVYFNQKEVYPWPDGYGLPDWRVQERVTN